MKIIFHVDVYKRQLMVIPNLLGVLALSGAVITASKMYDAKKKADKLQRKEESLNTNASFDKPTDTRDPNLSEPEI